MKFINKLLVISLVLFSITSCDNLELDLLDNPNETTPDKAELDLFFNNVQFELSQLFAGNSNGNQSLNDITTRASRMVAMTGGNVYENAFGPTTFDFIWNTAYAEILPDIRSLTTIATEGNNLVHLGAAQVMEAYTMMTLVDLFGDVPYTDGLQGGNQLSPSPDSGSSIYTAALGLLDSAIGNLSNTSSVGLPGNDVFYGGDAEKWIKAANSLKLRYYLTTRLVNSDAASQINGLIGSVITDNADDFQFSYGTTRANPDSRHPYYIEGYEISPGDYQSNYFMWSLYAEKGFEDPRLPYYFYRQDTDTTDEDQFTLDCVNSPRPAHYTGDYPWCIVSESGYWGRDHGNNDGIPPDGQKRTTYGIYPAGGKFDTGEGVTSQNSGTDGALGAGIAPIMTAAYIDFMLAEAAATMSINGDARDYLESAIRKSFAKVYGFSSMRGAPAIEQDAIDSYVSFVLGQYDNASDKMDVIGKEYHIALWGNGVEAYNLYRRTGKPAGMQPTRDPSSGDYPRSMLLPADHVNLNANASQKAITTQVFWDTNPAGFIE